MLIELFTRDGRRLARFEQESATVLRWQRDRDPLIVHGRSYAIVALDLVDTDAVPKMRVDLVELVELTAQEEQRAHRIT